jgi:rubrerythrin
MRIVEKIIQVLICPFCGHEEELKGTYYTNKCPECGLEND